MTSWLQFAIFCAVIYVFSLVNDTTRKIAEYLVGAMIFVFLFGTLARYYKTNTVAKLPSGPPATVTDYTNVA